jgi:tripartite-type tricarboxylate transporter receptor subunit TctC
MFAIPLSEALGRPVVVENKPGASGQIAAQALKASEPDGNTLLLTPGAVIAGAPHTYSKLAYSPLEDFVAVAHTGTFEYGLIVGGDNPAKNFGDWAAAVRRDRKNGAYGTSGLGTGPHFIGMMLAHATGLPLDVVAYKGVAPVTNDLLGNQLPAGMLPFGQLDPYIKSGKLRVLAHSGDRRASMAPDVPTFKELGYPSVELVDWYGLFGRAGTNPELIQRYNAIITQASKTPEIRQKMAGLGLGVKEMSAATFGAMVRADHERWRLIVKTTGYSAETK